MYVRRISTLDIEITILNSHFHSKVFDKQESFNFRIVDFLYMSLSSNIPSGSAYRICSSYEEFVKRIIENHHIKTYKTRIYIIIIIYEVG